MTSTALVRIAVGVAIERRKALSVWADDLWRPVSVFAGVPDAAPWTLIHAGRDATTYYIGQATIDLYRTETANYRSNLLSGTPLLWVILRSCTGEQPVELLAVTADPAEGEAITGSGNDLVETVTMAEPIAERLRTFVDEHHVERPTYKRQRDRSGSASDTRRPASGEST